MESMKRASCQKRLLWIEIVRFFLGGGALRVVVSPERRDIYANGGKRQRWAQVRSKKRKACVYHDEIESVVWGWKKHMVIIEFG